MQRACAVLVCLLLSSVPAAAQTAEQKKETIAYLQKLQQPDGGFLPAATTDARPGLRATSAAIRALKYFGGEVPNRTTALRFVMSCFNKAARAFADQPGGKPEIAVTAVGVMAVAELKAPAKAVSDVEAAATEYLAENAKSFEEIRITAGAFEALGGLPPRAKTWLKQLADMQNQDGTYGTGTGQARATGGAVACWLRLGGKIDDPAPVLDALRKGQRPDGGFGNEKAEGSDLEATYRVMRAFYMLKAKPDADKLRGFVAKCRNADGGYGVAPGQPSTVSATYFATIILHWLG